MALLDSTLVTEIQDTLGEPEVAGVWTSGLWTAAEVVGYLNQRQYQFLRETGVVLSRATIASIPNTTRHTLPADWVGTRRVSWQDTTGAIASIPGGDNYQLDVFKTDWSYNQTGGVPRVYSDGDQANLVLETAPAANVPGSILILYVALSAALTGAGVNFTVPDECVPAVKWGVIADMLSKLGRAHDPQRAQWAEQQYREGVGATKTVLGGWQ